MITRRQMIAGAASIPLVGVASATAAQVATPDASPVASPVASTAPTTANVLPAWQDAQAALRQSGEAASAAFWDADVDALIEMSDSAMAELLETSVNIDDVIEGYTSSQIQFKFEEVGAWFFGHYSPDQIIGVFTQGVPTSWIAMSKDPQEEDYPVGHWAGFIGPGLMSLELDLEFSGDADSLEVNVSIPTQFILDHPMTNVELTGDVPIGERIDTRVLPTGGEVLPLNIYAEEYEWGNHSMMLFTSWDGEGQMTGLNLLPQGSLPEIDTPEPIHARLPADGAWVVLWGGETEFRNYHAPSAAQRYAVDIAVWQDGATMTAPGSENENYHAFGQPYLAPVDGTVVTVMVGFDDITPQLVGSNPQDHPAGNHIVIGTDGGFVYLAHCQNGSIQVQEGDTLTAGDVVAAVGNSGNTTEAHIHIHAQTTADMFEPGTIGVPLLFQGAIENGEPVDELSVQQGTIVEHIT